MTAANAAHSFCSIRGICQGDATTRHSGTCQDLVSLLESRESRTAYKLEAARKYIGDLERMVKIVETREGAL